MNAAAVSSITPSPQFSDLDIAIPAVPMPAEQRLSILENLFAGSPVGMCLLDVDFAFVTLNERFARMLCLPIPDFVGRTMQETLPVVAAQLTARHYPVLGAKGPMEIELAVDRPSSLASQQTPEKLVYLWSSQPIRDQQGAVTGYSIALTDITLRKRYESSLREKEEYYRHAVELNPHIFWSTGPTGLTPYISPKFLKLTGLTRQAAEQEWRRGCLHADDIDPASQAWAHSLQTGTPYDCTYRVRDAAGTWRWMRVRAFPRRATSGDVLRWYGTMEDIHERRLLEEAREVKILKLEEIGRKQSIPFREDALTGLFNRRHFDNTLQNETVRARRSGQPLGLIMIDVDHWARYNQKYGQPAGDACLLAVGRKLGRVLQRQGDFAARYEADKFAILLPDTSEEAAMLVAVRAQSAIYELAIPHDGSDIGFVTISIGVSMFTPTQIRNIDGIDTDADPANLVKSAESALVSAKAGGRNRIVNVKAL